MKDKKTVIFLNLRFSQFYSRDLFKRIKEDHQVRFVAVIDQQFTNKISSQIELYLDKIITLPAQAKNGFLAEFSYDDLYQVVVNEMEEAKEVKIVCSDEFNLLNAGRLRRELGIDGHTDETLILYRDKIKMKDVLAKNHIRVPAFKLINQTDQFENIADEVGLPFVIKPVDSCGSYGVTIIHHIDEFNQLKYAIKDEYPCMEAEEYIEGKFYHVDSCIRNSAITFICASEYTCPNHDYTKGQALGSLPLDENDPLSIRLIDFAKKCLLCLKTNNMVNHIELFVTKQDEIIFLEVSGRPPGALINLTHRLNFGCNLMDEDFFMQADIDQIAPGERSDEHVFFAQFPLRPGKVVKLNEPPVQSRADITWHVSVDDVIDIKECGHIVNKSAHAIFYHTDKKILREDFEVVKYHQAIEVI